MNKTTQLSFTVLTIFIILVLGLYLYFKKEKKLCEQQHIPVNKDGLCVDSECQNKCREAKGYKGMSTCYGLKDKMPMSCLCGIPC
ncbi:unnamed protein product [Brassica rapa subsp. trilocularis]